MSAADRPASGLYRTVWRWHFYAGLFVMPIVLILAATGMTYLYKPMIERWEERSYHNQPTAGAVTADEQVDSALRQFPGGKLRFYRLPERDRDAVLVRLALAGPEGAMRDVFVSPQGKVLGSLDTKARIMEVVQRIHGQLLIGRKGSWIVELAASWAIVMLLTGMTLWLPKGRSLAGVIWPRIGKGKHVLLRDLHVVTGFWVSGLAMVLLLTGLPWADVWGSAFKAVRSEMGWVKGKQDWTIGGRQSDATSAGGNHADHDQAAAIANETNAVMADMSGHDHAMMSGPIGAIVSRAKHEHLTFPVLVTPPEGRTMDWTVKSEAQNRPLRVLIAYDAMTGEERRREVFADKHLIDRVIAYGVAWHEGALFGWVNQLIGTLTALALITLSVSGFLLWRRRKPTSGLGAPAASNSRQISPSLKFAIAALFLLLPLFALSLIALLILDRFALPHFPALARWLGLPDIQIKG